ncbi:MAG: succinylglutamate desuccinylase/aspartoacylase family protein [Chloroflexi bacterium]|nr:succinylglutamate desuccinylase/aspartoacylase family protein [Chloroflexota bacterium]
MGAISICGIGVAPGEKKRSWVKLTEVWNGPFCLPMIVAHGRQPGKTLFISAMQHGDEYDGFEAAQRIADLLDPAAMSGTVIIVPCMNIPAFISRDRFSSIDGLDMNRIWPGRERGFFAEQIVNFIYREVFPHVNYVVDLHGGTLHLTILPYASWIDAPNESALPLLKAAGVPDVHPIGNMPRLSSTIAGAARDMGIPSVFFETGGGCYVHEEDGVQVMVKGATNIMKHLGILHGQPTGLPATYRFLDCLMMGSTTGGYLFHKVKLGDPVKKGDPLGEIVNLLGEVVETPVAPFDGYVVEVSSLPKVAPGEWIYMVGSVRSEEPSA